MSSTHLSRGGCFIPTDIILNSKVSGHLWSWRMRFLSEYGRVVFKEVSHWETLKPCEKHWFFVERGLICLSSPDWKMATKGFTFSVWVNFYFLKSFKCMGFLSPPKFSPHLYPINRGCFSIPFSLPEEWVSPVIPSLSLPKRGESSHSQQDLQHRQSHLYTPWGEAAREQQLRAKAWKKLTVLLYPDL